MKETILVVDDEPEIVELFADRLQYEGYQVLKAYDVTEGKKLLGTHDVRVVILDLLLPKESGVQLLKHVNAMLGARPLVIAISAVEDHELRAQVVKLGAQIFFSKPIDLNVLVNSIRGLIKENNHIQ